MQTPLSISFHNTCITELPFAEIAPLARVSSTAVETGSARVHVSEFLTGSSSPVASGMKHLFVRRERGLLNLPLYATADFFNWLLLDSVR